MAAYQIAAIYVAVNMLLLVWLAFRVVLQRLKAQVAYGDGGSEPLARAIRTHGNAAEYIPIALIGLCVLATLTPFVWLIHAGGISLTLGRILHVFGFSGNILRVRQVGMMLTWGAILFVSGAILWTVFSLQG